MLRKVNVTARTTKRN